VDWYRKLLGAGAKEMIRTLNERNAELSQALPTAARVIEMALAEAQKHNLN